jgi:hypothetical protein
MLCWYPPVEQIDPVQFPSGVSTSVNQIVGEIRGGGGGGGEGQVRHGRATAGVAVIPAAITAIAGRTKVVQKAIASRRDERFCEVRLMPISSLEGGGAC